MQAGVAGPVLAFATHAEVNGLGPGHLGPGHSERRERGHQGGGSQNVGLYSDCDMAGVGHLEL